MKATGLVLDTGTGSNDFIGQVKSTVPILLEEEESRVRIAAGGWSLTCNHTHYITKHFIPFDRIILFLEGYWALQCIEDTHTHT